MDEERPMGLQTLVQLWNAQIPNVHELKSNKIINSKFIHGAQNMCQVQCKVHLWSTKYVLDPMQSSSTEHKICVRSNAKFIHGAQNMCQVQCKVHPWSTKHVLGPMQSSSMEHKICVRSNVGMVRFFCCCIQYQFWYNRHIYEDFKNQGYITIIGKFLAF